MAGRVSLGGVYPSRPAGLYHRRGLWTSDGDGGNARLIVSEHGRGWVRDPRWSHDGTKIPYGFGARSTTLPRGWSPPTAPAPGPTPSASEAFWSLDDRRLLFSGGDTCGGIASSRRRVGDRPACSAAPSPGSDDLGALSPGGLEDRLRPRDWWVQRIFLVDVDGTDLVRITDGGSAATTAPCTGPRTATACSSPASRAQRSIRAVVVNADGTDRRTLREKADFGGSPDGAGPVPRSTATPRPASTGTLRRMRSTAPGGAAGRAPSRLQVAWVSPATPRPPSPRAGSHCALGADGRIWTSGPTAWARSVSAPSRPGPPSWSPGWIRSIPSRRGPQPGGDGRRHRAGLG